MGEKTQQIDQFRDHADQLLEEERYEEAIELYLKLLAMNPGDESLLMSLAWAYNDSGQSDKSLEYFEILFERELKRSVFTGFAFDELVRIYRSEGKFDRLVNMCERVVDMQPGDVALLTTLGDACLKAGRLERAAEIFELLTDVEPDAPVLFCSLASTYIAAGDYEKAEAAYDRAVEIEPSEAPAVYHRMGFALLEAGQIERAEAAVRRSIDLCFEKALHHCTLGDIQIKQGRLDEARGSYEQAITIDPASAEGFYNRLGNALASEGYHHQAIDAFEKALEMDPHNPFYYRSIIESCAAEGLDEKAREIYEKARSLKVFD